VVNTPGFAQTLSLLAPPPQVVALTPHKSGSRRINPSLAHNQETPLTFASMASLHYFTFVIPNLDTAIPVETGRFGI